MDLAIEVNESGINKKYLKKIKIFSKFRLAGVSGKNESSFKNNTRRNR